MIFGTIASDIIGSHCISNPDAACTFTALPPEARPTGGTVLALAAAEWLIEDSEHTAEILTAYIDKWMQKFPSAGYGSECPYDVCAIPIGLYADTIDKALQLSQIAEKAIPADRTHSLQAVAAAIHLTRNGAGKNEIKRYAEQILGCNLGNNRTVAAIAIECFLESKSLEETIRRAVSSGNSTVATIAGAIASATPGDGYKVSKELERECISAMPGRMINFAYAFNHLLKHPVTGTPIRNSYMVDDRVYAGEYPATANEILGRRDMERFARFGITHFVDLTESSELLPYTQWLKENQTHIRFAIKDCGVPSENGQVKRLLETITGVLKNKENKVYIHCRGGIGRTGTIVACYYAMFLKEYAPVCDLLKRQFSQCPKSAYRDTPETLEQKRFIMQFIDYIRKQ